MKNQIEFFDECFNQNVDLITLSNSYILHIIDRTGTRKGSAKKLGLTYVGLKKRLKKFGLWHNQEEYKKNDTICF